MARIKYGSLVSDVSGSVGSATFQKSLYGNTLRSKPQPRRSASAVQITCRNYMVQIHNAWRLLSVEQRRQWNQYISFTSACINRDKAVLLTGHSLYIKYNFLRLLSGYAILNDLVYLPVPAWPVIDAWYVDINALRAHFTVNLNDVPAWPVISLSPPRQESRSFYEQGLRYMAGGSNDDNNVNFASAYQDNFGAQAAVGSIVHCRLQFFCTDAPIVSPIYNSIFTINAEP